MGQADTVREARGGEGRDWAGLYLLEDGDDRRLPLLQVVQHHEDVSVGRETASGRVPNVTALGGTEHSRVTAVLQHLRRAQKHGMKLQHHLLN